MMRNWNEIFSSWGMGRNTREAFGHLEGNTWRAFCEWANAVAEATEAGNDDLAIDLLGRMPAQVADALKLATGEVDLTK